MAHQPDLTIRPFEVRVPEEDLVDLQRRIAATRWPSKEPVADQSQGVQLATIQDLVTYWGTEYDWQARRGYIAEQGPSPQTIDYPLTDSPAGLAAWMLDHDADSYKKIARAFVDGHPTGGLTRDSILDNITTHRRSRRVNAPVAKHATHSGRKSSVHRGWRGLGGEV